MGFGYDSLNYNIVEDQAYTEDHVLVYNLFVYNVPLKITEKQALEYFKQFGEVFQVRLYTDRKKNKNIRRYPLTKIGFINFASSKVAAKVLQIKNHNINNCHIGVRAADSWNQPDIHTSLALHAAELKAAKLKSAETKADLGTEQPSCSNSTLQKSESLILSLNDDCLEYICKKLILRDQINFALTCQRFSGVFVMLSKVQYKMLVLDKMETLTLWQIRQFLEMAGPHIESLVGEIPTKDRNRIAEAMGQYCTNAKCINIYSSNLKPTYLRKLICKMNSCTELELQNVSLTDSSIPFIKCLPNLKTLRLEENCELTGKNICDFSDLEELSLKGSRCIQSVHFKEICKNLTNLHTLDIRHCMHLKTTDFKEMVMHLKKLENLKLSNVHDQYECIAQLPKLKRLQILDVDGLRPLRHQLLVELVKYKSEQLEELMLMSRNSLNYERASLVGDLKKLKKLCCGNNESIDDNCLEKFAQLTDLEEINLKNCNGFTNNGLLNLLRNCHKLTRLNIIRCKSLTVNFVYDALKLLKQQELQIQREGPVLLLANRTNIDQFVIDTPEFKSSSDLMKITFENPFFKEKFFDDFEEYFDLDDDSEFDDEDDDDDDFNFAGRYMGGDSDDDFFMYYSDADDEDDLHFEAFHHAYNLFGGFHPYGDDINEFIW